MVTLERLQALAPKYDADLKEYRLTGDVSYLLTFLNEATCDGAADLVADFFNALTENEKIAFTAITEEIGLCGNISVVKMIQKTNLSRPVWTSLLQKMEKYNVAQIKNQGVKGTRIEIREGVVT